MISEIASDDRPPVLQANHLCVSFGDFIAVRDVSVSIHSGELLGLIGPNGAGKTTLLRTLAGLQPPTSGSVQVLGVPLRAESVEGFEHIGFTPDVPAMYPALTVRQYLRFIGRGYGLSSTEIRVRTDFWLEKVWLAEKADAKIKGLSRGMMQRIGIARSLLPNPNIIILDEPAAGLDPAGRVQFRRLLCDLREQGKALIVSSHILADMDEYCTHIGIMSGGQMVRFGTVQEVSGATQPAGRCRYDVRLARAIADAASIISTIENVTEINVDQDRVSLECAAEPDAAANLLRELIRSGLPVASFTPAASGLEEAYLQSGIGQVD